MEKKKIKTLNIFLISSFAAVEDIIAFLKNLS